MQILVHSGTFRHLKKKTQSNPERCHKEISVPVSWSWENINGFSEILEVGTEDLENAIGWPNGSAGRRLPPIGTPSSLKPAPIGNIRYVSLT